MKCVVCITQSAKCSVQCEVCIVKRAVCSVQLAVASVQCAVGSGQCAVCRVQFTVCKVQCAMCSVQCAVNWCLKSINSVFARNIGPYRQNLKFLIPSPRIEYQKGMHYIINKPSVAWAVLGMGKGPKRTLKLVNYRLESRPLTDPRPRSLGLDLDSTQNRARPSHVMQ